MAYFYETEILETYFLGGISIQIDFHILVLHFLYIFLMMFCFQKGNEQS